MLVTPSACVPGVFHRIALWDSQVLLRINGTPDAHWTPILRAFTFLGREPIWLGLVAFFVFIYYHMELFVHFGLDLLYGLVIVAVLKQIIRRPRPSVSIPYVRVLDGPNRSFSFPSWHSYNLVAASLSIAYITNLPLILVIGLIVSAIVAFSRVYLGVHYPSDVIVGYLCGIPGFLLAWVTTPWWVGVVHSFESFAVFPTLQGWNYFLVEFWYWFIVAGIYGGIIMSGLYRARKYKKCDPLPVQSEICYDDKK